MNLFNYNPKGKGQANSVAVTVGDKTYFFSYKTCIAIYDAKTGKLQYALNEWGPTTGKHINWAKAYHNCPADEMTQVDQEALNAEGVTC